MRTRPSTTVDFMFFADQSCSMDDDNSKLGRNWSDFEAGLSDNGVDWQVIVANDDDGCNSTGVLTAATSGAEQRFSSAITDGGGTYTEAGLTVVRTALAAASGCNSGWVRPGSMVHAIMISDEPEQSSGSWSALVANIQSEAAAAGASGVMLSAIAGDYPSGCSTADAGIGYYEAVGATGGGFYSICVSDFGAHMEDIAGLAGGSGASVFALTDTPIEETLEVTVNGVTLSAWSYSSVSNAVTLDDPVEKGGRVGISYEMVATCD